MAKYICLIAVQKVQSFLFDALQSHEQEKQKNEYTLKKVYYASQTISKEFREIVLELFSKDMLDVAPCLEHPYQNQKLIPSGSGSVLFVIETDGSREEYIKQEHRLWEFFHDSYIKYQAQMRVRYAIIELPDKCYKLTDGIVLLNDDAMKMIKKIKKQLISPITGNEIIKIHQNDLFSFQKADERIDKHGSIDHADKYFVNNFKFLRPETKSIHSDKEDPHRFYIAFLKADLDGMGEAFRNVYSIAGYAKMSNLLNKWVSVKGIARAICETYETTETTTIIDREKFYPIYAAGDDIFCAVCVQNIPRAVSVYKYLLDKINEGLRDQENDGKDAVKSVDGRIVQLSMRIGIDITWANQPIRYYWQRAERQMNRCKTYSEVPDVLENSGYVKIAIGNAVFLDYRAKDIMDSEYKKNWKYMSQYLEEKRTLREKYKNKKDKDYIKQLKSLKTNKPSDSNEDYQNYINKNKMYEINVLREIPSWQNFLNDVRYINYSCSGGLHFVNDTEKRAVTTSRLYNLLDVLSEENNTKSKYMVNFLYRFIPDKIKSIQDVDRDVKIPEAEENALIDEAVIWHSLALMFFKKSCVLKKNNKTQTETTLISFDSDNLSRIVAYIKTLMLFCDPRFNISVEAISDEAIEYLKEEAVGDMNHLYTKFLDALFKEGNNAYKELFGMFVGSERFFTEDIVSRKSYTGYVKLSIVEKSMLYRFKSLIKASGSSKAAEKAAKMIMYKNGDDPTQKCDDPTQKRELSASASIEEIHKYNSCIRRRFNEKFDVQKFLKCGGFDGEFIDLLIVFYSYHSVRAAYKSIFSKKKGGK